MGRDPADAEQTLYKRISIHSPRMGRDPAYTRISAINNHISIHSPRMGRDWWMWYTKPGIIHFNPLSPHGERRGFPAS